MIRLSRAFSRFGDSVEDLAQMFLITQLTHSAGKVGLGMLLSALPNIIFSPIAGVVVDRCNKKKLMLICEMVRAAALVSVTLLMTANVINIWYIYLMIIINSAVISISGFIPQLITLHLHMDENSHWTWLF